ncbi:MAG TPA: hypothetical protein VLB07_05790 [Woeseiaceae bacterium]|nr:hypothetical protein [Woeseiaceae bacterium]
MILSSIIEHVRTQNWTAIAIDFVIVVLGVFIGIQVSNWNAERIERREEVAYLVAMDEDVSWSIESLIELTEVMERQSDARQALYAYSSDPDATIDPADRDRYLSAGLFHFAYMNIRQVTYDTLKGSGRLDAIGSPELIAALQSMSADIAAVVTRQDDELQATYLFTDPLLIANVDMANIFRQPNPNGDPPAIPWLPDVPPAPQTPELFKSTAFRNGLLYRAYFTSARLRDVQRVLEDHRHIAGLITARKAELGMRP